MNLKMFLQTQILTFIFLVILCVQCWATQLWRIQYPLLWLMSYYLVDSLRNIRNYKRTFKQGDPYLETIEKYWNNEGEEIEMSILIKQRRRILIRTMFEDVVLSFTCILLMVYSSQILPIPSYVCIVPLL